MNVFYTCKLAAAATCGFMKEYFDGNEWIDDIEKLKSICKIDPK